MEKKTQYDEYIFVISVKRETFECKKVERRERDRQTEREREGEGESRAISLEMKMERDGGIDKQNVLRERGGGGERERKGEQKKDKKPDTERGKSIQ